MQRKIVDHAEVAVREGLFFELGWPPDSQSTNAPESIYVPSAALSQLGAEIKALSELARTYNFDLPYAAPSGKSVLLPAIPKEWTSAQRSLGNFESEKARFDEMIRSLSHASKNMPSLQDEDASDGNHPGSKNPTSLGSAKTTPTCKIFVSESKVLNTLAKSKLSLRVPLADGSTSSIDTPKQQTLTKPELTHNIFKQIFISGVVKYVSNELRTMIIDDKYLVREIPAEGFEVGNHVTITVWTTPNTLKLDIVYCQPSEGEEFDQ